MEHVYLMHYYKRNLGDYAKKAGRLSMLQHGAYNLLIDACYDREQFPALDEAIDWAWASTEAEREAVEFVLGKFFTFDGERYIQTRIEEELHDYQEKAAKNKRIANERETKRKEKSTNRARTVNEPPPNQEPITNNHKPVEKGKAQKRFTAPTLQELAEHISTKGYTVDAERFFNHYESNGWMVGRNKMKSWAAALAKWNADDRSKGGTTTRAIPIRKDLTDRSWAK